MKALWPVSDPSCCVHDRAGGWVTQQQQPPQQPASAANAWGPGPGDQAQQAPRELGSQAPNGPIAAPAPAWGAPRQAAARQVCKHFPHTRLFLSQSMPSGGMMADRHGQALHRYVMARWCKQCCTPALLGSYEHGNNLLPRCRKCM